MRIKYEYKGESIILNDHMIKTQNLTEYQIDNIIDLHKQRIDLFNHMRKLNPCYDIDELKACVKILQILEYNLQDAWGFERDKNKHSWWFRAPWCECPKIDNADPLMWGPIIIESCPLHGF